MQIIISFNETHVFSFGFNPAVWELKNCLKAAEGIPEELIVITCDGISCEDSDIIRDENHVLRASLSSGLCGGKGGFGAQLRALAKQKAYRKTIDFGACRDLNGRRLRHVNDEILLQKWKEAKDKNEAFETDGQTPTGIDLWFLAAPSWAEGIKVDKRKLFMKPRMKTEMCIDWKRARERRPAPDGAPAHWGCPRGRRCEYAHGVDELRGEAQAALKEAEHQQKREEQHRKREAYMGVLHRANKQEEELEDLVLTGLRAAKRAKLAEQGLLPPAEEGKKGQEPEEEFTLVATAEDTADVEAEEQQQQADYLSVVSGTVVVAKESLPASALKHSGKQQTVCPVITGTSAFATVAADKCMLTAGSAKTWYYEVELQSDGLMQLGWCTSAFLAGSAGFPQSAESAGKEDAGAADGVGDDAHSWAFDGYRQLKWHAGESAPYGPQTGLIWKAGDVIGCRLQLHPATVQQQEENATGAVDSSSKKRKKGGSSSAKTSTTASASASASSCKATISYAVNGVDHGVAFEFEVAPTVSGSPEHFFPALSLENDEAALLNLGSRPFKFAPSAAGASSSSSSSSAQEAGVQQWTAVWTSVVGDAADADADAAVDVDADATVTAPDVVATSSTTGTTDTTASDTKEPVESVPPAVATEPMNHPAIALEDDAFSSLAALEALGPAHLKQELERRGMKAGGTLLERAQRLLVVRGLRLDQIDPKLLAKKK